MVPALLLPAPPPTTTYTSTELMIIPPTISSEAPRTPPDCVLWLTPLVGPVQNKHSRLNLTASAYASVGDTLKIGSSQAILDAETHSKTAKHDDCAGTLATHAEIIVQSNNSNSNEGQQR